MPNDEAAVSVRRRAMERAERMYAESGVRIEGGDLVVWMGEPAVFRATIPMASIAAAERVPDKKPGSSMGVHGMRGRWLVNSAYTGLVRLTIEPHSTALMDPRSALPEGSTAATGLIGRLFLRTRTVKLKELTVSVDDPDALIAALVR